MEGRALPLLSLFESRLYCLKLSIYRNITVQRAIPSYVLVSFPFCCDVTGIDSAALVLRHL